MWEQIGALLFGVVIGWVTYRTLRRSNASAGLSDIATVIGSVGGAAVTTLFEDPDVFGLYATGLAAGFFGYLVAALFLEGPKKASSWMGSQYDPPAGDEPTATYGRP